MKKILLSSGLLVVFMFFCSSERISAQNKPLVTFIELGSVNCIPCKKMQPVMKRVEQKYGSQVKVVFYDIWTAQYKAMADKYKIRVIPTQVFLSADGKEYFRHEGYYPFEELEKVLKQKGVK
jgi:thioredoxin 1